MRSIGAAIIIASACAVFIAAGYVRHHDTALGLILLGIVVGAIGLRGWFKAAD